MNNALTAVGGWAVALAIAAPIIVLFWWARRHEPVTGYEADYSVERRSQAPAEPAAQAAAPTPHLVVDVPELAMPATLAPPAEPAVAPAITVILPAEPALPPEPPTLVASAAPAPTVTPEPPMAPAVAVPVPSPAPEPVTVIASAPTPLPPTPPAPTAQPIARPAYPAPKAPAAAKEPEPKPEPPAVVVASAPQAPAMAAEPSPVASVTTAPEPEPVNVPAPEPAVQPAASEPAAEPVAEGGDDFTRIFGIDAAIAAVLQGAGFYSYRELAAADVRNLRDIMSGDGQPATDPTTWPQQARFAAGGKWKQLEKMQARFKGEQAG